MRTRTGCAQLLAICGAILLGGAAAVHAAPAEAPASGPARDTAGDKAKALPLFRQGIAKFDAGYYREAISLFEQAYKLFPSAKIHTRIALCHKWLGNNLKALEHYEAYLRQVKGTPEAERDKVLVKQVETEVRNLLQLIGQLRIVAAEPPGTELRVNGKLVGVAPLDRVIRIAPGPVNITAIGKGYYPFKRDLQLVGGQLFLVKVSLIKIKPKVIRKIVTIPQAPWYKRWWFWTSVGVVLAAGAAGAVVGSYYTRPSRELEGARVINTDSLGVRF